MPVVGIVSLAPGGGFGVDQGCPNSCIGRPCTRRTHCTTMGTSRIRRGMRLRLAYPLHAQWLGPLLDTLGVNHDVDAWIAVLHFILAALRWGHFSAASCCLRCARFESNLAWVYYWSRFVCNFRPSDVALHQPRHGAAAMSLRLQRHPHMCLGVDANPTRSQRSPLWLPSCGPAPAHTTTVVVSPLRLSLTMNCSIRELMMHLC